MVHDDEDDHICITEVSEITVQKDFVSQKKRKGQAVRNQAYRSFRTWSSHKASILSLRVAHSS